MVAEDSLGWGRLFVLLISWPGGRVGVVSALEDGRYGGVDVGPWGKWDAWTSTGYSLLFHLIDVGAVAAELWDQFWGSLKPVRSRCGRR